jgi:arylsulfatase A-like enzyme
VDLLPTFCAAAGVVPPADAKLDGESMLEALEGKPFVRTKPLFWLFKDKSEKIVEPDWWAPLAVREGDWKLLCSYDGQRVELYNFKEDRDETELKDLSREYPEISARLTQMVLKWHATLPMERDPTTSGKKNPETSGGNDEH